MFIVNTDSGMYPEVFTMNQNDRSQSVRTAVHDKSKSVFTVGQNTHYEESCLATSTKIVTAQVSNG